jgi:glycosyltransferase involved in cell wall biosynthesis
MTDPSSAPPSSSAAEQSDQRPAISVIVPVFEEAESLPKLHEELLAALAPTGRPFEILYINDGSTDASGAVIDRFAGDPRVVAIHFRRNHGQTAAMTAGIDHARGEILVPIDADLQNDPADIPKLVAKLDEGFDVVSGWRVNRQDDRVKRKLPSVLANRLISWLSGVHLHDYGCSLKAYRRDVLEGVRLYGEMHRFIPIFARMQGGRVTELPVNHRARRFGRSKYGLERVLKVLLDLMVVKFLASYTTRPIYVFGGFGLVCLLGSGLLTAWAVFFKLMPRSWGAWHKDFVETPLPVMAAVCTLVGFLALLQGLLAEMLMRTYFESQGKKPYLIKAITRERDSARSVSPESSA